ncbi:MAG: hypothetical protein MUO97_05250, partial [Dehalococcoidia bacterium]|nr:hypothetical protein [Dehalococcoidia bacterium]
FPKNLSSISGLQPFLLVALYTAENTYRAIRYIAADLPEDPSRKLEFGLVISPLGRLLADILFTIVFMREDLGPRVIWYHRGGWRELKEDFERHRSEYAALAEWQEWLKQYEGLLEHQRQMFGISEQEAANPKVLQYWPIPGQMLRGKTLSSETREFLQFLNDWVYKELSADAHMSAAGIMRRHGFLLLEKEEGRQKILSKLKSDGIFTSTTLLVAICTEINDICRYGREKKLSYLWRILVEYWGEAKDLFERRYEGILAAI